MSHARDARDVSPAPTPGERERADPSAPVASRPAELSGGAVPPSGLIAHLANSSVERREAALGALQGSAGNRRVAEMVEGTLARQPSKPPTSPPPSGGRPGDTAPQRAEPQIGFWADIESAGGGEARLGEPAPVSMRIANAAKAPPEATFSWWVQSSGLKVDDAVRKDGLATTFALRALRVGTHTVTPMMQMTIKLPDGENFVNYQIGPPVRVLVKQPALTWEQPQVIPGNVVKGKVRTPEKLYFGDTLTIGVRLAGGKAAASLVRAGVQSGGADLANSPHLPASGAWDGDVYRWRIAAKASGDHTLAFTLQFPGAPDDVVVVKFHKIQVWTTVERLRAQIQQAALVVRTRYGAASAKLEAARGAIQETLVRWNAAMASKAQVDQNEALIWQFFFTAIGGATGGAIVRALSRAGHGEVLTTTLEDVHKYAVATGGTLQTAGSSLPIPQLQDPGSGQPIDARLFESKISQLKARVDAEEAKANKLLLDLVQMTADAEFKDGSEVALLAKDPVAALGPDELLDGVAKMPPFTWKALLSMFWGRWLPENGKDYMRTVKISDYDKRGSTVPGTGRMAWHIADFIYQGAEDIDGNVQVWADTFGRRGPGIREGQVKVDPRGTWFSRE
jgi:hypothetical protein